MKAIISNIERLATYDGPGLRTVIYFKGCPLKCVWCSNPETQNINQQVLVDHSKCINCNRCVQACPNEAIEMREKIYIDENKCEGCSECIASCPTAALKMSGREYQLEELMSVILKDKTYYQNSNGGITVSGGEMLMHADFVIALFKLAHENGITTAIESSSYGSHQKYKQILNVTDHVMLDYKLPTAIHQQFTGRTNKIIKTNIEYAVENHLDVLIRVPIIPTVNERADVVEQIIEDLKKMNVKSVELLRYHTLGLGKYEMLNREYQLPKDLKISDETFKKIIKQFKAANITVVNERENNE